MSIPDQSQVPLISTVQGEIKSFAADDALMQKGTYGSKYSRLQLKGLDHSKFAIRIMSKFEQWVMKYILFSPEKIVPLHVSGKKDPVVVNVGSLCKRLLLTEKEVREAYKGHTLEALVQKRADELAGHEILENYELQKDRSVTINKGEKSLLDLPTLLNIGKAYSNAIKGLKEPDDSVAFRIGEHRFNVFKIAGQQPVVVTDMHAEDIAEGQFGKVIKTLNIASHTFLAIKIAQKASDIPNTKREYDILMDIHKNGNLEGVQAKPIALLAKSGQMAYLGHLYYGDAWDWSKNEQTVQKRLECCQKIMQGFYNVSMKCNYWHKDIKPMNMLLTKEGNPVIADLGSAKKLSPPNVPAEEEDFNDINRIGMTVHYCDLNVLAEQEKLAAEGKTALESKDQQAANRCRDKVNRLARYQDFYAMRESLKMLSGVDSLQLTDLKTNEERRIFIAQEDLLKEMDKVTDVNFLPSDIAFFTEKWSKIPLKQA